MIKQNRYNKIQMIVIRNAPPAIPNFAFYSMFKQRIKFLLQPHINMMLLI